MIDVLSHSEAGKLLEEGFSAPEPMTGSTPRRFLQITFSSGQFLRL